MREEQLSKISYNNSRAWSQVGQMAKIISEEQQMSLPKLEESRRVEVDAKELHELVVKEEGSTSLELKEKRKKVETIPEMIL